MALATRCPHCGTAFRVAADQLKLRGGIVRCGACKEVFNGNATLIDLNAAPEAAPGEPAAPPPPPEPEIALDAKPAPSASDAFDAEIAEIDAHQDAGIEQLYTLDFDTAIDSAGAPAQPQAGQPEPEPAPEPFPEPVSESLPEPAPEAPPESEIRLRPTPLPEPQPTPFDMEPDEEIVAVALPDGGELDDTPQPEEVPDAALLLARQSVPEEPGEAVVPPPAAPPAPGAKAAAPHAPHPASAPEPAEPEQDEPEFVRRSRLQEQAGRTRRMLMAAGSALLVCALLAQGVTTFRNVLAARFPQLKPVLASSCALLGCRVELPAQVEELSIETGELEAISGNTFLLGTVLHNQSRLAQAWPNIELALTDADNKTVLRRVFAPAEYLPKDVALDKGFAGRTEQPVRIYFQLDQIKASGYHIAVFYP